MKPLPEWELVGTKLSDDAEHVAAGDPLDVVEHERILRQYPSLKSEIRPGERLICAEQVEIARPATLPSALKTMYSLARATGSLDDSGPVLAAMAAPRRQDCTRESPHLRLFEALFGRDSLICARILQPFYPGLARRTILALAALQGADDVVLSEEEPGRIPHEVREPGDPIAEEITATSGWQWPYYGSIDATCLWITMAVDAGRRDPSFFDQSVVGRDSNRRSLMDCIGSAVKWLLGRLHQTRSGLLESSPRFPGSTSNQVWKDSPDSYSHEDGSLAKPGTISSVEVQGAVVEALMRVREVWGSRFARAIGVRRDILDEAAYYVRAKVLDDFWIEDDRGGFFALGLDRDAAGYSRRLAVRTSNMGHLLCGPILDGDDMRSRTRRIALMDTLASPDIVAPAGLRTLSIDSRRYRPSGYHNGSCWPWDTYMVSQGLRRHGRAAQADDLCRRIFRACREVRLYPEFFIGDTADRPAVQNIVADVVDNVGQVNRICQPPQEIQAWTVASMLAIKRAQSVANT